MRSGPLRVAGTAVLLVAASMAGEPIRAAALKAFSVSFVGNVLAEAEGSPLPGFVSASTDTGQLQATTIASSLDRALTGVEVSGTHTYTQTASGGARGFVSGRGFVSASSRSQTSRTPGSSFIAHAYGTARVTWSDTVTITSATLPLGSLVKLQFSLTLDSRIEVTTQQACPRSAASAFAYVSLGTSNLNITDTGCGPPSARTLTATRDATVGERIPVGGSLDVSTEAFAIPTDGSAVVDAVSCQLHLAVLTSGASYVSDSGQTYDACSCAAKPPQLGVALPAAFAASVTGGGAPGGAPNTWVTPFAASAPGSIRRWQAQFLPGDLASSVAPPAGIQLKVLQAAAAGSSRLIVVGEGAVHDPRPALVARFGGLYVFQSEESVMEFVDDPPLPVNAGDVIGVTILSVSGSAYIYPFPDFKGCPDDRGKVSRVVVRNAGLGDVIDLADIYTGTLPGSPALTVTVDNTDNTRAGTNVAVQPVDATTGATPVSITFASVSQAGGTALTTTRTGPATPRGFSLGVPPTYFDLTTTATFSGSVTVCIDSSGMTFPGAPRIFHYENGQWLDKTVSVDTTNHLICARVSSLSPFAVFADDTPPAITITTPAAAPYALGAIVFADYACTDEGMGIDTCLGTVASGGAIDTSSLGTKTFTVVATDRAGNTTTQSVSYTVTYRIRLLYDPALAHRAGSVVPVKIQLTDAKDANVSALSIVVTARALTLISTQAPGPLDDAGNANQKNDFRFDATLGATGGYIYNLSTKGLAIGTWDLRFTVASDPTTYHVQFQVK